MLRKLVIWLLLIPLPLNGLWLVCKDSAVGEQAAAGSPAVKGSPECIRECALKAAQASGATCFFSAGDTTSVTIIVFGVAILPPVVHLQPLSPIRQPVAELTDHYLTPSLAHSSPPPKV